MGPFATLALLGLLTFAQVTLVPAARLGSAAPLLPLLAVVSWGLVRDGRSGLWWAILAGLMLDLVSPAPVGMYTLPLVAAAAVVAAGRSRVFDRHLVLPALLAMVATATWVLGQLALIGLMGGHVDWTGPALAGLLAPALALNLLWLPLLFFPLRALARRAGRPRIEWEL